MAAGGRRKRTDGSQGSGKNGQRGRCGLHCGVFGELVVGAAINAANQYWVLGGNSIEKSCMRMRAVEAVEHERFILANLRPPPHFPGSD